MNLRAALRTAQRFAVNNSPGILTAIGVVGTLTTAALTGRAAFRVGLDANAQHYEKQLLGMETDPHFLDPSVLLKTYWRELIPPATVGILTVTAIIGANRVGARRAAALAAAFKISEKMADEYRQKMVETLGPQKEEMARSELAKERIQRVDDLDNLVITGAQEIYYDAWSGRAFLSTRDKIDSAINQLNYQINQNWSASLSDLYDLIGLPRTAVSDEFGWNSDELLEPYYTATLLDDRRSAVELRYNTQPVRDFNRIGI